MTLGLLLGATLALSGAPASAPGGSDELDVPFVAQTPLLCGGAAAAMVERFWGARGRDAEDYLSIVRPTEGGIRTSDLMSALRDNGYLVHRSTGTPEAVTRAIADGVPPIVLLGRDQGSYHYVVVTAMTPTDAVVHDPNFGPDRLMALDDFLMKWAESDYWTIEVVPGIQRHSIEVSGDATPNESRSEHPVIDSTMTLLRDGRHADAVRSALTLVGGPEEFRAIGYQLLATARYLDGDATGALDAWNVLGTPTIDHVEIDGLGGTRYHVAASQLAVHPGETLTSRGLRLSERRLAAMPSIRAARVSYRPNLDGTVQVDAALLERDDWPTRLDLMRHAVRGAATRTASISTGPMVASGDVWTISGSWSTAQRGIGGSVRTATTLLPGIVSLGLDLVEERHVGDGATAPLTERRLAGSARLSEWVTPHLQLSGSVGLERWSAGEGPSIRAPYAGFDALFATRDDDHWVAVDVDGWTAEGDYVSRGAASFGLHFDTSARTAVRIRAGGISTSSDAPRTLWPGAGTGTIRGPLLRAHPLDTDGTIAGAAFGPELAHATAAFQLYERYGPARLGATVFADAAAVRRGEPGRTDRFLDYGVGAFADLGAEEITISLARGTPGWALSLRVDRWAPSL